MIYVSFLHLLALCSCLTCEAIFAALRLPGLAPRDCSTVVISTWNEFLPKHKKHRGSNHNVCILYRSIGANIGIYCYIIYYYNYRHIMQIPTCSWQQISVSENWASPAALSRKRSIRRHRESLERSVRDRLNRQKLGMLTMKNEDVEHQIAPSYWDMTHHFLLRKCLCWSISRW